MIERTPFGTAEDGREVHAFTLSAGGTRVRVMDFGATLLGIETPDAASQTADILLGFEEFPGYLDNSACHGATIGPSANRTDRAEVPLGGTTYHLPANDGPEMRNNLHTDLEHGLHKRLWASEVNTAANAVRFTCRLSDGELGLPGNRTFTVSYTLVPIGDSAGAASSVGAGDSAGAAADAGAQLTVEHTCTTDAPTYVNMTNHAYFNLAGHASGSALGQIVQVHASHYLPLRADNVSLGEIRPVEETPLDFRAGKPLGADIDAPDEQLIGARGYDHCLCVDGYDPTPGAAPRAALHAEDEASGRMLDIAITAPGTHLYTGNWLDDHGAKGGGAYAPRDGFAFEPEFYPDNVHHDAWPHPVCTPDQPYSSTIVYRISHR